jgi:hypothetical protein
MARLLIIFLLSSSALLLLSNCAYNKLSKAKSTNSTTLSSTQIQPLIPALGAASKYKTEIDVLNKHFTGILVLKQTDSLTKHCVFVTELGMRMFDFSIKGDSIKADFVFDALNKPSFVKILTSNFRDILLVSSLNKKADEKHQKNKLFYWLTDGNNSIALWPGTSPYVEKLKVFSGHKKHSAINYSANYSQVKFKQHGLIKLRIELNRILEENK